MNGRLAAKEHDGARAVAQRFASIGRDGGGIEGLAGAGIPTGLAGDAKGAAKIAAAQRNGEGGDEFEFVGDFNVRGKETSVGAGVAKAVFTGQSIYAAIVRAEAAIAEHLPGNYRTPARHPGTRFPGGNFRDSFSAQHTDLFKKPLPPGRRRRFGNLGAGFLETLGYGRRWRGVSGIEAQQVIHAPEFPDGFLLGMMFDGVFLLLFGLKFFLLLHSSPCSVFEKGL
jgi:hypothetical protein